MFDKLLNKLNFPLSPEFTKVTRNITWLLLDKVLRIFISAFVGLWMIRYLGPDQYGNFNYLTSIVGIFVSLTEFGLAGIVVRDIVLKKYNGGMLLCTAFVLQTTIAAISICIIFVCKNLYAIADNQTETMLVILSLSLIFKPADVIKYWFESQIQSRPFLITENFIFISTSIIKIFLIYQQASLMSFVAIYVLEYSLVGIGLFLTYSFHKNKPPYREWSFSSECAKHLIIQSWPLLLGGLAVILYMRLDIIMLKMMVGNYEAGIYSSAMKICELFYFLPTIIISSMAPVLTELYKKNNKKSYIKILQKIYFYFFWMSFIISLTFSIMSEEVVTLFYGENFIGASPIFQIYIWGTIAVFLGVASSQYLLIEGYQKISFYRTLLGLAINILLNFILIPSYSGKGAAIATLISYFIATLSPVMLKESRKHFLLLLASVTSHKQ